MAQYSGVPIQRVYIASSKLYALVQLKSVEEASYLLNTFNRIVPYIDNCAGKSNFKCHRGLSSFIITPQRAENFHILSSKFFKEGYPKILVFNRAFSFYLEYFHFLVIITFSRQSLNQVVIQECIARGQLPALGEQFCLLLKRIKVHKKS